MRNTLNGKSCKQSCRSLLQCPVLCKLSCKNRCLVFSSNSSLSQSAAMLSKLSYLILGADFHLSPLKFTDRWCLMHRNHFFSLHLVEMIVVTNLYVKIYEPGNSTASVPHCLKLRKLFSCLFLMFLSGKAEPAPPAPPSRAFQGHLLWEMPPWLLHPSLTLIFLSLPFSSLSVGLTEQPSNTSKPDG